MVLIKPKYNDNMTTNCGTLNFNMKKIHILSKFLVSVALTWTLSS